ncbi:hypothetical protein OJF2_08140 [Aquisphaera giovannonii]|uniref:Lipocalin-like domain-containing protein n=1 Tax=Aquisphaera giovannonii TaxID=406548 RepID=A0A5B9VWA0_9BACT|nr:lipocalin family protein [Aquisphaera giovannonii]QEH32344.1 hypothetical protein OJF2_08140 [Aquisphaera giovannonii]
MRRPRTLIVLVLPVAALVAAAAGDEPKAEAGARRELVGTWRLVSARYGGQEYKAPEGTTTIKHVTPTQFMWASYDAEGRVSRAAGGRYSLDGDAYVETPEYGLSEDFDVIKGKPQAFRCKVEGKTWHHDGKLSNDLTIEEVWERVEPK